MARRCGHHAAGRLAHAGPEPVDFPDPILRNGQPLADPGLPHAQPNQRTAARPSPDPAERSRHLALAVLAPLGDVPGRHRAAHRLARCDARHRARTLPALYRAFFRHHARRPGFQGDRARAAHPRRAARGLDPGAEPADGVVHPAVGHRLHRQPHGLCRSGVPGHTGVRQPPIAQSRLLLPLRWRADFHRHGRFPAAAAPVDGLASR